MVHEMVRPFSDEVAKTWPGEPMLAEDMLLETCFDEDLGEIISVSMLTADGSIFGHIHLPNESALELYRVLGELIMELSRPEGKAS
jgi:hypothetical protein